MTGTTAAIGRGAVPVPPADEQVSPGTYTGYAEAQRVVDRLAHHDFEIVAAGEHNGYARTHPRSRLPSSASGHWAFLRPPPW